MNWHYLFFIILVKLIFVSNTVDKFWKQSNFRFQKREYINLNITTASISAVNCLFYFFQFDTHDYKINYIFTLFRGWYLKAINNLFSVGLSVLCETLAFYIIFILFWVFSTALKAYYSFRDTERRNNSFTSESFVYLPVFV